MPAKITMYLGSLDHSPSEQLGQPDEWHTTVLILSHSNEHFDLASDIATQMLLPGGTLKKWSGRRGPSYKARFENALSERLAAHAVHTRAISAQAATIAYAMPEMLRQLGLDGLVVRKDRGGKRYLRLGPFMKVKTLGVDGQLVQEIEPVELELPEHQAIPLIFICHFLFRIHQALMPLVRAEEPEIEWADWQVMPNKFPGGLDGKMATLFGAITSGAASAGLVAGNIRVLTFKESKQDHGSMLADNIAGLLAEKLALGERSLRGIQQHNQGISFCWEVWQRHG